MRTQVAIIGGGPSGLLLSQILYKAGIDSIVLERRSRDYVESRIRAGVLEQVSVDVLDRAGVGARMHAEGLTHDGFSIVFDGEAMRIDMRELTGGAHVMVYGQTELTKDLNDTIVGRGGDLIFEAEDVALHEIDGKPYVAWRKGGAEHRADCDFIAGCDGYHGVSRASIPPSVLREYEKVYPFGWLGILADVPPCDDELIYSNHARGFALASMRSRTRSRYYIQCALDEHIDDWPDEKLWDELAIRLGPEAAAHLTRGPALEKSIAPLRSFVAEPMRYGALFLAGDAAHIVPPTGAKGLNLAASDVYFLSEALIAYYQTGATEGLDTYSEKALARVWKAERFSWYLTSLTHRFAGAAPIERKLQIAELDYMRRSQAAQRVVAENYVGLPL
ncbi:MAG: 4-hydroxybenzoate 3-monooxygenase [Pseudomonadota bacterium]|nr:4-hydroxybenzoate 3-monooxygenase [Pseudomonadota bacterium]